MSFAAVAVLIAFYEGTRNWWNGLYQDRRWHRRIVLFVLASMATTAAATLGTAGFLRHHGVAVDTLVAKVGEEGLAADAVQLIAGGKVQMVVNTPRGRGSRHDGSHIRAAALAHHVACITTLSAARAAVAGMSERAVHPLVVRSLQELHR